MNFCLDQNEPFANGSLENCDRHMFYRAKGYLRINKVNGAETMFSVSTMFFFFVKSFCELRLLVRQKHLKTTFEKLESFDFPLKIELQRHYPSVLSLLVHSSIHEHQTHSYF